METARDDLAVGDGFVIPAEELSWRFSPSGGPGGQHANRSNTRAEVTLDLSKSTAFPPEVAARMIRKLGRSMISVVADETRSQWRNRRLARERLAGLLVAALETPRPRRPTRPSAASRTRRLNLKRVRSAKKRLRTRPEPED